MASFESLFPEAGLRTLSGEFYPPQTPGRACTLSILAFHAIHDSRHNPHRTPLEDSGLIYTYTSRPAWGPNIEVSVDATKLGGVTRVDTVFLNSESSTTEHRLNELRVDLDERAWPIDGSPERVRVEGREFILNSNNSILMAATEIALVTQAFLNRAHQDSGGSGLVS